MKTTDLTTIEGKNVIIDITQLLSDEVLYINATKLAKQFGKDVREWLRNKETRQYIEVLTVGNSTQLEIIKTKEGRYGGTYIHSDLSVFFLRWLSPEFAVKCDMYIKHKIQEIHNEKLIAQAKAQANQENEEWLRVRNNGKETRKQLTDAIQLFCNYASTQREAQKGKGYGDDKCPYYIKLTQLVYKALGLKKPKSVKNPREIFNGATVEKIEYLEERLLYLIKTHIQQSTEYHEAFKSIKEAITHEAELLIVEVA